MLRFEEQHRNWKGGCEGGNEGVVLVIPLTRIVPVPPSPPPSLPPSSPRTTEIMKKCVEEVNMELRRTNEKLKGMKGEYQSNGTVRKGGKRRRRKEGGRE